MEEEGRPEIPPATAEEKPEAAAFYVAILGKRGLNSLQSVEFHETLDGVKYDAECKHCFPRKEVAGVQSQDESDKEDSSSSGSD